MKLHSKIAVLAAFGAAFTLSAQNPWLHLYYPNGTQYKAFDMTEVLDVTFDEAKGTMTVNVSGLDGKSETVSTSALEKFVIGPNVPVLRFTTDEYYTEVPSKEYYLSGTIDMDGRGVGESFNSPMQIRGRGNSTWGHSKKPYRVKFAEKTRMLLPKKQKNFVLLANALDPSMMRNFAAFKFGEYIEMPYINHSQPVDVYFNDIFKGSYHLTEKCGFNNGSVDLSKEDEPKSIMFELDTYSPTEEDHPFNSDSFGSGYYYYSLPVRIKDPDAPEDVMEMYKWEEKWQNDFNEFMAVIATGNVDRIYEACDLESLVRYVMVNNLACNQELDHPKSVYLWKTEGGKYNFGPCWDFDWAFGYQPTYKKGQTGWGGWGGGGWGTSYPSYENPLLAPGRNEGYGGEFFYALCGNDRFKKRFREVWDEFYKNHLDEFWADFDAYAELLRPSANFQGLTRSEYQSYDKHVKELRDWVAGRIEYINSDKNMALWEDDAFE